MNIDRDISKIKEILKAGFVRNYKNPIIPTGFHYICGTWKSGYVIEDNLTHSQYVWIPVGYLISDGTIDGKNFDKKFGRRNFYPEYTRKLYEQEITAEFLNQCMSIVNWGGFYISRFNISKSIEEKPLSIQGGKPWVDIDFNEAIKVSHEVVKCEDVSSHLIYGAEYDSMLSFIEKTGAKSNYQITVDSSTWGSSINDIQDNDYNPEWAANEIYGLAGIKRVWTQEYYSNNHKTSKVMVARGGSYGDYKNIFPVAYRNEVPVDMKSSLIGFRVALCIKKTRKIKYLL